MTSAFTPETIGAATLYLGDSREVLKTLPANSIDAVVTDPPYALVSIGKRFGKAGAAKAKSNGASGVYARASAGFMGQRWDTGETAFDPLFWAEVLRVLKPGGHLVAFSATRTYHRLACSVEDAGFEIRDMLAWLYGSGFPKSHDISKAIDKAKGCKREKVRVEGKFGHVPNLVGGEKCGADRPWRQRAEEQGFHEVDGGIPVSAEAEAWRGFGSALKPSLEPVVFARKPLDGTLAQNVLKWGCGGLNIDGCRVSWLSEADAAAAATGFADSMARGTTRQSQSIGKESRDGTNTYDPNALTGRWPANLAHDGSAEVDAIFADGDASAARFFYSAKADAADRMGSGHPTVKPVDLMAWLCRLVTPPGGVVLDPFSGSGTTGLAAIGEGRRPVLIEREEKFAADIRRRMKWAIGEGRVTALEKARLDTPAAQLKAVGGDLPLFGGTSPVAGGGGGASTGRSETTRRRIGPVGLRR